MSEITINKNNKSITFINNGIGFSQFGVADEILDLIRAILIFNSRHRRYKIIRENYFMYFYDKKSDIKYKIQIYNGNNVDDYLDIFEDLKKDFT